MKEKILARFKAKYPAVNLSKKRLDALADKLEPKITDESQIDTHLDAINDAFSFDEIAKNDDKIREQAAKLKTAATPKEKTESVEEPEIPSDAPEWMKAFMKQQADANKSLSEKLAAFEMKERTGTIKEKIATALKGKDGKDSVPEVFWSKRQMPQKEEEIEAFVADVKTDHSTFTQTLTNHQLNQSGRPAGAATVREKGVINPIIKAFADKNVAQQQQAEKAPSKASSVIIKSTGAATL